VDVVLEDGVPRGLRPGVAGEVDDGPDVLAGLPHEVGVLEVADEVRVVRLLRGRVVIEQAPVVRVGEPVEDGPADAAARARQQHGVVHVARTWGNAGVR